MRTGGDVDSTWLKYMDLHRAVSTSSSSPPHKTFSSALDSLVKEGVLEKETTHRGRYRLRLRLTEQDVAAVVAVYDTHRIETASKIGSMGDLTQGWTIYGVHRESPRSLQQRLRAVCRNAQEDLVDAAIGEAEALMQRALAAAKSGLDREQARTIREYLNWAIAFRLSLGNPFANLAHFKSLEKLVGPELVTLVGQAIPGALRRVAEQHAGGIARWWKPAVTAWESPDVVVRGLTMLFTAPDTISSDELTSLKRELRKRGVSFARMAALGRQWITLMVSFTPTVILSGSMRLRLGTKDIDKALEAELRDQARLHVGEALDQQGARPPLEP